MSNPTLYDLQFDATGYKYQGEPEPGHLRIWHTPEGDEFGLFFFRIPPDLPSNADSADVLAAFYGRNSGNSGGKVVEVGVVEAGGCAAIRTILSFPQEPSGCGYLGALTLPFRDFSFVLKCQCFEHGDTGLKAAVLLSRVLATGAGPMPYGYDQFHIPGYDPDDPRHDAEFPNDPVARLRRVLDHLTKSLVVDDEVKSLPPFPLPRGHATVPPHLVSVVD